MNKIRFKFKRTKELRLLSHLDQQRLFQRALRRGNLNVAYSQGFNPHPKIAFGLAMSVGLISDCEYGDVVLTDEISSELFKEKMNRVLPKGLSIIEAFQCEEGTSSLSASLLKSQYLIRVKLKRESTNQVLTRAINDYLDKPTILMDKRTKKGKMIQRDIRCFIEDIRLNDNKSENGIIEIEIDLKYIDQQCIKPELLLENFNESINDLLIIDPTIEIYRKNLILKK
jgi:radical SAM-linked protein